MITQDDPEAKPAPKPGERALAIAIEMVCDGREEVGSYLTAVARSTAALRDARIRCLARFADRTDNRGVLLRALALIDGALDLLGPASRSDGLIP